MGSADAVEQLRDALAVGCTARGARRGRRATRYGPADVAAAIAEVVRAARGAGTPYDLVLLGNDAADTGDFQVGVRLAYALERPVVTGISTVAVDGLHAVARGDGPEGTEVSSCPLPAVVTVMEGGVAPRYPSVIGRMKAKKAQIETRRTPAGSRPGSGRVRLKLPPQQPSQVEVLGEGADAAPAVVDLLESLGVLPMTTVLVLVETDAGGVDADVARGADLRPRSSARGRWRCRRRRDRWRCPVRRARAARRPTAWTTVHVTRRTTGSRRTPRPRGPQPSCTSRAATGPGRSSAAGTPRGNEMLAHVAARLDVAMAANVVAVDARRPLTVTRQVVGGAALEEMRLADAVGRPLGRRATRVEPAAAGARPRAGGDGRYAPQLTDADLVARVVRTEEARAGPVGGADRRPGSSSAPAGAPAAPTGSRTLLELTDLLGGALGVSRVVTSLGWRPHHEQVGQTGSRIAPGPLHRRAASAARSSTGPAVERRRRSSPSTPTPTPRWSPRPTTP